MNIIRARQEEREEKLREIEGSLKKAIRNGQEISYEKTLLAIISNIPISKRTAIEYLDIVLFRMKMKREDLDKGLFPELESLEDEAQRKINFFANGKIKEKEKEK